MAMTLNKQFGGNVKVSTVKNRLNSQNHTEVEQARIIKNSLGIKVAAGYMRNRGWSVEAASYYLSRSA
jgi:hypothetical protein